MYDHAMMIPSRESFETVSFWSDHRGLLYTNAFARFPDAKYVLFYDLAPLRREAAARKV
jgi:hypothetical protein